MRVSRRSAIATATAGLTSIVAAAADNPTAADEVANLVRLSRDMHGALMRGEVERYRELITLSDDFTLMSPFGGKPTRGTDMTAESWQAMKRFFRNGTFDQELVQSYASTDMVVLAIIERQNVEVGGLPAQDWPLRVTLVYRRDAGEWRLAHRHADPLVQGISLQTAAALARGGDASRVGGPSR